MPEPKRVESRAFALHEIETGDRLRPVSEGGVASILSSLEDTGAILSPVWVRKRKTDYVLLDGAHRLEAARRAGLTWVPGVAFHCTDRQARLLEIDGNLAGAELGALDTAVFLAGRKKVYEDLHPETKYQTGAELARKRWDAADTMSVASFVTVTAEKFGLTERHVRRLAAAGAALGPAELADLRRAPQPVTLADLQEIAKIGEPSERYAVCAALGAGDATRAREARRAWAGREAGGEATVQDPDEAALRKLLDLFDRAPKSVQRRFVAHRSDALGQLIADHRGEAAE